MSPWRAEHLMLCWDSFFSYSIGAMKILTNLTLGYEVSLKFADPAPFEANYLFFTGFLCLLIGWLTDSYLGKFYVTLIGVLSALLSCISYFLYYPLTNEDNSKNKIVYNLQISFTFLMLFYISTSNARNNLILDQIRLPKRVTRVRRFLFYLVYIKLLGRLLFRCLFMFSYSYSHNIHTLLWKVNVLFAIIFTTCYFFFILSIGHRIFFEALYFQIWEKCIICLFSFCKKTVIPREEMSLTLDENRGTSLITTKGILHQSNGNSGERQKKHVTFSTMNLTEPQRKYKPRQTVFVKEPPYVKVYWGFRGIITESDEPRIPIAESYTSIHVKKYLPIFWGRQAKSERSRDQSITKIPDLSEKEKKEEEYLKSILGPDHSVFVLFQAFRLREIFFLMFPGVSFGLLSYVISMVTLFQADLALRPNPYESLQAVDITIYSIIFDLLLFPFVEFLLLPLLKKICSRDVSFTIFGSILLIVSGMLVLIMQMVFENKLQFIPKNGFSQIRLFNSLSSPTNVHLYLIGSFVVKPYDNLLIKNIKIKKKKSNFSLTVRTADSEPWVVKLNLIDKRTISFIITKDGLMQTAPVDPTIFMKPNERNDALAHYFLVSPLQILNKTIEFVEYTSSIIIKETKLSRGKQKSLVPGEYFITCIEKNIGYNVTSLTNMEGGGMYAVFIYFTNNLRIQGEIILLEGPFPLFYENLLFQVFLTSFAQAMATVSYLRFIYLESPSKLRTSMFNIIFALNFFSLGFFNTDIFKNIMARPSRIVLTFVIIEALAFVCTVVMTSKFPYRFYGH